MADMKTNKSRSNNSKAISFDEVRELVIRELRAGKLSKNEQDALMQKVGDALLERAMYGLLNRVPAEKLIELSEDDMKPDDPEKFAQFLQMLASYVPNMQEVIEEEIRAGMKSYQDFLDKRSV